MEYIGLLNLAKAQPSLVDFKNLRMAFAASEHYAPYESDLESEGSIAKLMEEERYQEAINLINSLLEKNYVNLHLHLKAVLAYRKMELDTKATNHRDFAFRLLDSIMNSGDGRSFDTAYVIIDTQEEHTMIAMLGFAFLQQRLVKHDGHDYDILTIKDNKTGEESEIYFNIDIPIKWLDNNIDSDLGSGGQYNS